MFKKLKYDFVCWRIQKLHDKLTYLENKKDDMEMNLMSNEMERYNVETNPVFISQAVYQLYDMIPFEKKFITIPDKNPNKKNSHNIQEQHKHHISEFDYDHPMVIDFLKINFQVRL